jgi:hypothetical protein
VQCRMACSYGTYQLCHTNSECGAGKTCIPQNCPVGLKSTEACSLMPGCTAL